MSEKVNKIQAYSSIIKTLQKKLDEIIKEKDKISKKMFDMDGKRQGSAYSRYDNKVAKLCNLEIYYKEELENYGNLITNLQNNDQ